MKLKADRATLIKALAHIQSVAEKRNTIPILANALIANMPDGTWELVTHPGYNDRDLDAVTTRLRATREIERQALLRTFLKNSQNPGGPELINYAAVGPFARLRELGQFEPNTGHEAYL